MNVYQKIKEDILWIIFYLIVIAIVCNFFGIGVDDTDKDGWHRSGFELLTDYGTGKQYLYRKGVIIERTK